MKVPFINKVRKPGMGDRNEAPMNDGQAGSMPSSYQSMDNHSDQAEDLIISNLEAQSRRTQPLSDGFRPAVLGERAPLGVDSIGTALGHDGNGVPTLAREKRPSFKQMVRRVQHMNAASSMVSDSSLISRGSSQGEASASHRRAKTLLASIDEKTDEDAEAHEIFMDLKANDFTSDFILDAHHEGLDFLWNQHEEEEMLAEEIAASERVSSEHEPLLGGSGGDDEPPDALSIIAERRRLAQKRRNELRMKRCLSCLNPFRTAKRIIYILFHSTFVVSIPFFCIAWILFYHVGNPELDFMPGHATISWWLNFFGRCFGEISFCLVTISYQWIFFCGSSKGANYCFSNCLGLRNSF